MSSQKNNDNNLDEPKIVLSKKFKGKCPYCGSNNVQEGIITFGYGALINGKLPEINLKVWHCLKCKKGFFVKI